MPTEQDIQSHLQNLTGQPMPDQETPMGVMVVDAYGNEAQMEMSPDQIAALGMGLSQRYMAKNGSTQPRHVRRRAVMTKAQLEEQKMNEAQGYPSNLDEAAKVRELEQKVDGMAQGIQAILGHLNGGTNVPPQPTFSPPPQNHPPIPSYPALTEKVLSEKIGEFHEKYPNPKIDTLVLSQNDSGGSTSSGKRLVKLSNGRTIEVDSPTSQPVSLPSPKPGRNVTMGPTPEQALVVEEPEVIDAGGDLWTEEVAPPEFKNDPKVEKLAFTVQEVNTFLRNRDPHLFFRRVLPRTVSRQVGFSAWPKNLQERFNGHFRTLLTDPVFVRGQVATALSFEFGYGLSAQKIAELVALSAGFMAFSLAGAEVNQ